MSKYFVVRDYGFLTHSYIRKKGSEETLELPDWVKTIVGPTVTHVDGDNKKTEVLMLADPILTDFACWMLNEGLCDEDGMYSLPEEEHLFAWEVHRTGEILNVGVQEIATLREKLAAAEQAHLGVVAENFHAKHRADPKTEPMRFKADAWNEVVVRLDSVEVWEGDPRAGGKVFSGSLQEFLEHSFDPSQGPLLRGKPHSILPSHLLDAIVEAKEFVKLLVEVSSTAAEALNHLSTLKE